MAARNDPPADPFVKYPAVRQPGRDLPKQVVLDSTRPAPRMRAAVEKASSQAITTGAAFTTVTFATVLYNPVGLWTASKFTLPSTGKVTDAWQLSVQVTWAGDVAGTRRQLRLRKNGATTLRTVEMSPVANAQSQVLDYTVNDPAPADFYEALVSHDAGHDVNITPDAQFSIIHLW